MESESFDAYIQRMKTEDTHFSTNGQQKKRGQPFTEQMAMEELIAKLEGQLHVEDVLRNIKQTELRKKIDQTLDERDKKAFLRYTNELNSL